MSEFKETVASIRDGPARFRAPADQMLRELPATGRAALLQTFESWVSWMREIIEFCTMYHLVHAGRNGLQDVEKLHFELGRKCEEAAHYTALRTSLLRSTGPTSASSNSMPSVGASRYSPPSPPSRPTATASTDLALRTASPSPTSSHTRLLASPVAPTLPIANGVEILPAPEVTTTSQRW
ncbi:hypothetical protein GSI_07497 [Ganoderma sinense ZZ0214-1]|uniref:Uncharacterized protein n=1 Tax=Ganoderma sinense ZZ0214-1 TaxID=1077348 RepID=A0A2G8S974_9APHY|nr:hypothetical protein GSI_07497 [Ganoderma sinense ZZ0214-1]